MYNVAQRIYKTEETWFIQNSIPPSRHQSDHLSTLLYDQSSPPTPSYSYGLPGEVVHLFAGAVSGPVRVNASLLAGGELLVASVIRVVHVVVDGVDTGLAGAGVTADGAARGGRGLGGGVGNQVAGAGAAALEGVVEAEPVTDLVGGGVALVVVGQRAAGDGRVEHGAAVLVEVGGARGDRGGEVAVAQVAAHVLEEVDVQGRVGALAERLLHGELVAVAVLGPVGVDGLVGALEDELVLVRGIGRVESVELSSEESILGVAC